MNDYERYRGKCKELSEQLVATDPTLTLVRGYYHCWTWGKQPHWWCKTHDGTIIDPSRLQFPSRGLGDYEEFTGEVECEYCGKSVLEENAYLVEQHVYCSGRCYYADVM
jgi:hypothetical protein